MYKKCKRDYQRSLQNDIETLNTGEPKEFWRSLKRLGPKPKSDIPMEVYNDAREIESDLDIVLDKWKDDYYSLFGSRTINTGEYDSELYDYLLTQLQILENIETEDNELNYVNEVNNVVKNQKIIRLLALMTFLMKL